MPIQTGPVRIDVPAYSNAQTSDRAAGQGTLADDGRIGAALSFAELAATGKGGRRS